MTQNQQAASNILSYTEVATPIGALLLITSSKGFVPVVAFGTLAQNQEDLQVWIPRWFGEGDGAPRRCSQLAPIVEQLEEYFRGER